MDLSLIKKTAENTASAIANVLEMDVIIVNTELEIIGNTFKNMVEKEIYVDIQSIVGKTVSTGEEQIFIDKYESNGCRECNFIDKCVIRGVFAVPIILENNVVGAIGAIFKNEDIQQRVKSNKQGVVIFMRNMAELLSSKLRSVNQIRQIKEVNRERELIIETITDALVYVNNDGNINYHNRLFAKYFNVYENIINKPITKVLKHNLIDNFLHSRKNVDNSIFILNNEDVDFIGLIKCKNIKTNGELVGTMMIFSRIEDAYNVINEVSNNASYIFFDNIICQDPKMLDIIKKAKQLAISDKHVLIKGPGGVGKKLFASSIHNFSKRKDNYYLAIDCKAMTRSRYLSELFGISEYGKHIGKFQLANGGTILFEEIGELPLNIQIDLLQYLNTGRIELEEGIVIKNIDVRLIATTRDSLHKKIKEGDFNEELYYLLTLNELKIPGIKERSKEDFIELLNFYVKKYSYIYNKKIDLDDKLIDILYDYDWPGNVKQLQRVIEKIIYNAKNEVVLSGDIKLVLSSMNHDIDITSTNNILKFDEYEKLIIKSALDKYKNHKNAKAIVADKLGIGRATLYRKIDKYNLQT